MQLCSQPGLTVACKSFLSLFPQKLIMTLFLHLPYFLCTFCWLLPHLLTAVSGALCKGSHIKYDMFQFQFSSFCCLGVGRVVAAILGLPFVVLLGIAFALFLVGVHVFWISCLPLVWFTPPPRARGPGQVPVNIWIHSVPEFGWQSANSERHLWFCRI